jgi:hypothetical protein
MENDRSRAYERDPQSPVNPNLPGKGAALKPLFRR